MARVLGLAQRQKDGRKMGSASVTMKSRNVRSKDLFNEKHNARSKGLLNEKQNVRSKGLFNENQSVRSKGNEKHNARSKGLFNEKQDVNEKKNVRSKGLLSEKTKGKAKVVSKGESRLAGQANGKIQGTVRAETLHVDRKKSFKVGTALSSKIKLNKCKSRANDESLMAEEEKKPQKKYMKLDPNDITNKRLDDDTLKREQVSKKREKQETQTSKNAQFRAILPSPDILSYISNNLIGRRRSKELMDAGYNIKLSASLDNIPFSESTEREPIEENVFRNKLQFFAAAKISSSFPPANLPEIAFAGRSNVGKSSLLNALTRQWGVVRTSDKPGLTQTINFFKLGSKLCLVDLPGYGFAYAKEEVKESWEELVKEYVSTRVGLNNVCLLVDAKWGMKPGDHELITLMERSKTRYQIVLTKTDIVFPLDVARHAMQIQEALRENKSMVKPVMMVSSKSGAGIRSLRAVLSKLSRFARV